MSPATTDAPPTAEIFPDLDQVREHFLTLNRPGEVREVRILEYVPASGFGAPSTASGYFDNADALVDEIRGIGSNHADGIYITQNPVNPDLLARSDNRLKRKPKATTSDGDIIRLAHFTVDVDPVRPSGISASDVELAAALDVRDAIIRFVTTEPGWPEPLVVMRSGNGGQATWRIDLPPERADLVAAALNAISALYSTAAVSVDTTLANPSRIVKLSGTVAAKGDPIPGRPHRRAESTFHPNAGTVSEDQLRALVALAPPPVAEAQSRNGHHIPGSSAEPYDIPAILRTAGIGYREREKSFRHDQATVYELDHCLSSNDHTDGAAIYQFPNGAVAYTCQHNRCRGAGWQDVKARLGISTTLNGRAAGRDGTTSGGFGGGPQERNAGPADWPVPASLPECTPAAPTMPAVLVPEPLRPWVVDIADRSKLPVEMVATPSVVAAAAVVGRTVGLRPGEYDDFTVVASLWGALIARPGWLKSAAIKEAFRPLGRLAGAAHEAYVEAEDEQAIKRERIEAEIKAIKHRLEEAAKKGGELTGCETELRQKRADLREAKPSERRYLTHDPTVEKLGELLRDNPRGMLLLRDELSGWLRALDKAGREGDREFYLEAWNGTGSYTSDRIGRGTIHIPAVTLSLFGGIQPGKLGTLLASAVEGGAGDDGLVQRLQATVWPDRLPPWARPTHWPDPEAVLRADAVFDALAVIDGETVKATSDDIPFLRYSAAAQGVADTWRDALEHRLRSDALDDVPAFAAHIAKYRSLMPTLALVFYLIDVAVRAPGVTKGAVGEQYVRLAADWCDFLEAHACKLYAGELHAGASAAHALAAKIEAGALFDGQSVREIYRAAWTGLRTPERVLAGLGELSTLGWVRLEFSLTGGRSSQVVRLHPDLIARDHSRSESRGAVGSENDA